MSTNKTQNYQLHVWEPGDDFLLAEMNENFALLDASARMVCGTYTGDGKASQFISLGFTPRAVLVIHENGNIYSTNGYWGGLALTGAPVQVQNPSRDRIAAVEEGGFRAYYYSYGGSAVCCNGKSYVFHYLALA